MKRDLEALGWLVYVTTCGAYMKGLPDLLCFRKDAGVRLVDVKRPSGSVLTKAQCQLWVEFSSHGLGVWIVTGQENPADAPLFGPPNWTDHWKPRYDKYLLRDPAAILEEFNNE